MQPTMVRTNQRYRGPVESVKLNMHALALQADLTRLFEARDAQEAALTALKESLRQGRDLTGFQAIVTKEGDGETRIPMERIEGMDALTARLGMLRRLIPFQGGGPRG